MMNPPLALLVSDIDGTLVTPDKQITPEALKAVADLKAADVHFTVVSSRPPRGIALLVAKLGVTVAFSAFNGASVVEPGGRLVSALRLSPQAARAALDLLAENGIEAWVFADDLWLARDAAGLYTEREHHTLGFAPTLVTDFGSYIDRIDKIVGVSDQPDHLAGVESLVQERLGSTASAIRSQTYYLDITHPDADKGHAVRALAAEIGVDLAATAVIGDQGNDVAMFKVAGFSIAMGQSPADVQAAASAVTAANTDNGFAKAVETLVLPRAAG
jgi:Cof subfamily protein (haloacid dehalogenase superfamily)